MDRQYIFLLGVLWTDCIKW